jgi:TRAP-type mannitol/chloroaromatic compound transport system permease small subunit
MRALLRLSAGIDTVINFIGRSAGWLVTIMILIGVYNVITRYIGSTLRMPLASNAMIELQWYLFGVIFFLGASYVLLHNEHVRVDFLYGNFGPKKRAVFNIIGALLFLIPFCIIALYVSWRPTIISWGYNPLTGNWRNWEMSSDPGGLPRAPIRSMILVGFGLLLIQGISETIKNVAVLLGLLESKEKTLEEEYRPIHEQTVTQEPVVSGNQIVTENK